jgi:hypothetical protein
MNWKAKPTLACTIYPSSFHDTPKLTSDVKNARVVPWKDVICPT